MLFSLSVWAVASDDPQRACKWIGHQEAKFVDPTFLEHHTTTSQERCMSLCLDNDLCKAVEVTLATYDCYLRAESSATLPMAQDTAFTIFDKHCGGYIYIIYIWSTATA